MHFRQVEVDEQVFDFVKRHAEPLVDTFNSALRRLLPLDRVHEVTRPATSSELGSRKLNAISPDMPNGIPQALRQILEVAYLVRTGAYTRTTATSFVAKKYNVFPQTVLDKYCRQLGLTAREFDQYLEEPEMVTLRKLLKSKFAVYAEVIDEVLMKA